MEKITFEPKGNDQNVTENSDIKRKTLEIIEDAEERKVQINFNNSGLPKLSIFSLRLLSESDFCTSVLNTYQFELLDGKIRSLCDAM